MVERHVSIMADSLVEHTDVLRISTRAYKGRRKKRSGTLAQTVMELVGTPHDSSLE